LDEKEFLQLINPLQTPIENAELLGLKISERILIYDDAINIKYKETYTKTDITDYRKYILTMSRKLVNQSFAKLRDDSVDFKFMAMEKSEAIKNVLKLGYYEDIVEDIEYNLIWEEDQESDDEEEEEGEEEEDDDEGDDEEDDNDKVKQNKLELVEESDDDDDDDKSDDESDDEEDDILNIRKNTHVVKSIRAITNFI
jgi:hypothetical protein